MITTVITTLIGVVTGNITAFLFFPQLRKTKIIENEAKQSEEWRKLYLEAHQELKDRQTEYEASLNAKDAKIDELYAKITQHRDEKAEIRLSLTDLQVEVSKLKLLKCERPNCPSRIPPTGY